MEFYFVTLPIYLSITICAITGVTLFIYRRNSSEVIKSVFIKLILVSLSVVLIQSLLFIYYSQNNPVGSFSMFYNVVNLFILMFLYFYRKDMELRFYIYWSFALLFLMGMEIRALQTLDLGIWNGLPSIKRQYKFYWYQQQ